MLDIIPAIDLRCGKAVRLQRGDFDKEERVAEDPVAVAESFAEQGATRLHVVDLDGAKTGAPQNGDVIAAILKAVPSLRVQVGGGIRSVETAACLVGLGADRLIVGTSAARDEPTLCALMERFADRLIIGADASEGFIAVQGWLERTGESAETFGRRMVALGARRFLFTDISRDGMLHGVNVEATRSFARAVGVPVLASGGVSAADDIERLAEAQPDGVEGVIIGKALYSGRLSLADALKSAMSTTG
jgi:phosphoribosylformimino-5-aminoimidazole carboxamide ribotide isomerase